VLDCLRTDFDRIELLVATLGSFSRPVPTFQHRYRATRQHRS